MEKRLPSKGETIRYIGPDGDEEGTVSYDGYQDGVEVLRPNGRKLYIHWAHIIYES